MSLKNRFLGGWRRDNICALEIRASALNGLFIASKHELQDDHPPLLCKLMLLHFIPVRILRLALPLVMMLACPLSVSASKFKALREVMEAAAKVSDDAVDVARMSQAAKLANATPEEMAAQCLRVSGLEHDAQALRVMQKHVDIIAQDVAKMGSSREVLTWSERASDFARQAGSKGDLEAIPKALICARRAVQKAHRELAAVKILRKDVDLRELLAAASATSEQKSARIAANVALENARTEALAGMDAMMIELEQLSPLLSGRAGIEPQAHVLASFERLERYSDAWRWTNARSADSLGNATKNLDMAKSEKLVPAQPAASKASKAVTVDAGSSLVLLANRERQLIRAEARSISPPKMMQSILQSLSRLKVSEKALQQAQDRGVVFVVKKEWARQMRPEWLTFFGNALLVVLGSSTVLVVAAPVVSALAWIAFFALRKNQLRIELYSEMETGTLANRSELSKAGKAICTGLGMFGKWAPWIALCTIIALMFFPVGLLFADTAEDLPGFWNTVGFLLWMFAFVIGVIFIYGFLTMEFDKKDGELPKVAQWGIRLVIPAILGFVLLFLFALLVSPNAYANANLILASILVPAAILAETCGTKLSSLKQVRSPLTRDFDALILRSFARDQDASPIGTGIGFEKALCAVLERAGFEAIAVGQPWEIFPSGAAGRVYLPMFGWESFVIRYIRMARVIFVLPGDSKAVIWENAALKTFSKGERVVLFCPYETERDRKHYDAFRENVSGKLNLPAIAESGLIVFDNEWRASFIPIALSGYASERQFTSKVSALLPDKLTLSDPAISLEKVSSHS